ncbi:MAG: chemotaxis protein CheB [Methylococcales bacterium]|nr:chemotaxis protein CheB [Methylococcales bacterium]
MVKKNTKTPAARRTYIVGIGASAGGLEALEKLFRAMPVDSGMAFVVIRHLSPDFKSLMGEHLERYTTMPAISVMEREIIAPNTIYLLPPKKDMVIEGDELICTDRPDDKVLSLPINTFFRSLATAWGEKAVAIVLSGTGSYGSAGIMDVHESGGLVFAQSVDSSGFDGMPRSAVDTGCVDSILSPEEMPAALNDYAQNPEIKFDYPSTSPQDSTPEPGIPSIFERLQTIYNIDFNFYKPQTIKRRIERRIALHPEHISIEEYGQRIQDDRTELDLLRQKVIPSILKTRTSDENEVRVWVCGCSTGEEAYSIAILFLEAFEHLGKQPRLKILATDLHRESLRIAAEGIYLPSSFSELPDALREKYFIIQTDGSYKVIANLRKTLIFSEHNVLKDPPFTRIDLVSCRNLLIYLQNPAQLRAIAFFHFALKINGYLILGASEGLGELATQFHTEDQHWKVFTKIREDRSIANLRAPLLYAHKTEYQSSAKNLRIGRVYGALLTRFIPSGILVNHQQEALHIFGNAARYLRPPTGIVSTELSAMAEGKLRIALLTALRNAEQRKMRVSLKGIPFSAGDISCHLDITVEPLPENTDNTVYYIVLLEEQVPDM